MDRTKLSEIYRVSISYKDALARKVKYDSASLKFKFLQTYWMPFTFKKNINFTFLWPKTCSCDLIQNALDKFLRKKRI